MANIAKSTQLHHLQPGDRITYHGINYLIEEHSSYRDSSKGYHTEEWLLKSTSDSEYYLMREYDPENPNNIVTWYLANEITNAHLFLPDSQENIVPDLWHQMYSQSIPYPELLLFNISYHFESETQGNYIIAGQNKSRLTWDYWDNDHTTNLAIEAFPHQQLNIYLSKVVKPEEFSHITQKIDQKGDKVVNSFAKTVELIAAMFIFVLGLLMLIFG